MVEHIVVNVPVPQVWEDVLVFVDVPMPQVVEEVVLHNADHSWVHCGVHCLEGATVAEFGGNRGCCSVRTTGTHSSTNLGAECEYPRASVKEEMMEVVFSGIRWRHTQIKAKIVEVIQERITSTSRQCIPVPQIEASIVEVFSGSDSGAHPRAHRERSFTRSAVAGSGKRVNLAVTLTMSYLKRRLHGCTKRRMSSFRRDQEGAHATVYFRRHPSPT